MSQFRLPKNVVRRTSGLTILNGKLHAVRYIWEEGLQIKQLVDKGICRVKSGIAIEESPKQYLKSFLRGDSTGKKMIWWDDNFIDQNLSYEDASRIIPLMDNIFKTIMKEEGFQSRSIHNDRTLGTEMYENDNYEELIDLIQNTWDRAYRIAYESITKNELPNSLILQEFTPRNMQKERMIDPTMDYLLNEGDKCTIEVPGGSGKSKCSARISQLVCEALGLPWKVLGVAPNISTTIQLCNEYAKFYKGQTGQRLLDLYFVGSANSNDYRLLESWANVYSVSDEKLGLYLKQAYESPRDCAFFVVNKSTEDFLVLADKVNVNFKEFFTILDEIHEYSRETGVPKMVTSSQCAVINPKYSHLFGKKLGLSATHINRPEHIEDVNAVYNDDLDKFGPCKVRVTEIEAREYGWICDKQGVVLPIPTDEVFTSALADNASFNMEMFGVNKAFNPVTFVGVEGIRLLSYNNKVLVLVSRRIDVAMIAEVLKLYQDNNHLDSNFEIIEGYAECGNACVNSFNKAKRAIMIATRWIGVGNDTYTCDCTLPLYNPESRAFVRQFGMRSDRVYNDKVSTFALVASESRLQDSPWFESLQMISNGEQLNIVSQAQFREQRESVIGGRRNITLIQPERQERPEVSVQWEEIMRLVSAKNYIDEATGKTRFSEIVGDNIMWYTYDMVANTVKQFGFTKKVEFQTHPIGNRYYLGAKRNGFLDKIIEEFNLQFNYRYEREDWDIMIKHYNLTSDSTVQEVQEAALDMFGKKAIMTKARKLGWLKKGDFKYAKREAVDLTPDQVRRYITENNLIGKEKNSLHIITKKDNKSSIDWCFTKVLKAYNKFFNEGKIEELLVNNAGRPSKIKGVNQYDLEGNFITFFKTVAEAARAIGRDSAGINSAAKGKQSTAGGFIWKYAE